MWRKLFFLPMWLLDCLNLYLFESIQLPATLEYFTKQATGEKYIISLFIWVALYWLTYSIYQLIHI